MIPVYKPYLPKEALKYAHDAIDSTWLSSKGKYLSLVSEKLQELLGVKHALLVNNGTSATHLVAKGLKFHNKDIENIIAPNNVYVAALNSFLYDNNYVLHTIDANLDTWNFDLDQVEAQAKYFQNAAILIVHNVGNIINVPWLKYKNPNILFVEDNCEGFLGKYGSQHTGTVSLLSSISFFGNKNITSGEGGCVLTNDTDIFEYLNCVQGQGQSKEKFVHCELGYNYRMTNVQAALLYGQLQIVDEIIRKKQSVFSLYTSLFKHNEKIILQQHDERTTSANWMFGLRVLDSQYKIAEKFFSQHNIEIRPMFYPASAHNHLINNPNIFIGDEYNSKTLNEECIILPSFPELSVEEINYITKTVDEYIENIGHT